MEYSVEWTDGKVVFLWTYFADLHALFYNSEIKCYSETLSFSLAEHSQKEEKGAGSLHYIL